MLYRCLSVEARISVSVIAWSCASPADSMPAVVQCSYSISLDDSPAWKVSPEQVKEVDGTTFAKVVPWNMSLINMIIHGMDITLPKQCRPSLAHCPGFQAFVKCRNQASDALASPSTASSDADAGDVAASLFGVERRQQKTGRKVPKMKASTLHELRQTPTSMEFTVPGCDGSPEMVVAVIRPWHPCDDVWVQLCSDAIEQMVRYIRHGGVDLDSLTTRRQYGSMTGLWKNGSAGLVQKIDDQDSDAELHPEMPKPKRRFKSVNEKASKPIEDMDPTHMEPLQDCTES